MDRKRQEAKKLKIEGQPSESGGIRTRSMTHHGNVMNSAPIYNLNDDCLREIFDYLPKRQLIKIERVCKKWREVALSIWLRKGSLNYKEIIEMTHNDEGFNLNTACFKSVLKRCPNLRTLNLFHPLLFHLEKNKADAVIRTICRNCKNLKHLNITGGLVSPKGFSLLEQSIAPNLESFEINRCDALTDEILEKFLKKAIKLVSLSLNGNSKLSGRCLVESEKAFKELKINFCDEINAEVLNKVLDNSPELEVCQCPGICTFKELNERPLREHLVQFQSYGSKFFQGAQQCSLPFPNLRSLKLKTDISVNNEMLSHFYQWFPNLESLDLCSVIFKSASDRTVLNNEGIKKLAKMPKLNSLNLQLLTCLTGDTLVYLAANTNGRIKSMECAYCHELRDSEMVEFVSLCPNLTYLDVSCCQKLTEEFLKGVLNFKQLGTSKELLRVRISNSKNCNVKSYNNRHPLLVLEEFNSVGRDFAWFIGVEFYGLHQNFEIGGFENLYELDSSSDDGDDDADNDYDEDDDDDADYEQNVLEALLNIFH